MSRFFDSEEARLDPALAALRAGSRVGGGRFTLLRLLGRGGMGVVWLARDEQLREGVALKFLPPEIRHDAVALDDLRRETSRSRKLTHPHIIRIHDLYKVEEEAFISMEYIDGPNLSELRLQQPDGLLKWSFLEPLVKELCGALDYAHGERIVHRDLKPANMMLDGRGRLKLADFGIAAIVTDAVSRVSGHYAMSGTACYMSPQQLDGKPPQVTDDIYSLGATLYELLTSRAPFFAGDIAHQVRTFSPQPLEKRLAQLNLHNPVPVTVGDMILTCLSKEPEKRPQNARGIAEQMGVGPLPPVPRNGASSAQPPPAVEPPRAAAPQSPATREPATAQPSPPQTPVPVEKVEKGPDIPVFETTNGRGRRLPAVAFVALAAIIAFVGGALWWARHAANNTAVPKAAVPAAPEFVSLFNGHDFTGWQGDPEVWMVQDGMIVTTNGTSKERRPVALFWTGGTVEDFELRLSFRIRSGNSGIYYRAAKLLGYEVGGYQFEISGPSTGLLIESGSDRIRRQPSTAGFITTAQVINGRDKITQQGPLDSSAEEVRNAFRPSGWNDVVITVQSNHIIHTLNGCTIVDTTDQYEKRPRSGTVALEVYGATPTAVQFRDIRLKRLPPSSTSAPR
jgi:serine/threonine protein kinase